MKPELIICAILITALLCSPAWAGCGKWVVRYAETDFLEDDIFDEAVASSTGSSATLNPDGTPRANQSENSTEVPSGNETAEDAAPLPDLNGKWLLTLNAVNNSSSIDLILIQSGDRVQGYGSLQEGASVMPATITGSLSSEAVRLDVKVIQPKKDIHLDMTIAESGMQGSYALYIDGEPDKSGSASARRSKT
jgi:hypothetical protein